MKNILHKSRIQHLIEKRNGYLLLAGGSILLNIILGFGIVNAVKYQKVILVPPVIEKPTWVTSYNVSPEYLSGMSLFLANLLLNVTPSNVLIQHQLFLRYVDSALYEKIKTELLTQGDRLQKEHMTISFQLSKLPQVDAAKFVARVTGDVQYMIGDTAMPAKSTTYLITYTYKHGQLMVKSFEEVTANA